MWCHVASPGEGNGNLLQVSVPGKIPWSEEPGGLQSMALQRVGYDWVTQHTYLPVVNHTQLHAMAGPLVFMYLVAVSLSLGSKTPILQHSIFSIWGEQSYWDCESMCSPCYCQGVVVWSWLPPWNRNLSWVMQDSKWIASLIPGNNGTGGPLDSLPASSNSALVHAISQDLVLQLFSSFCELPASCW